MAKPLFIIFVDSMLSNKLISLIYLQNLINLKLFLKKIRRFTYTHVFSRSLTLKTFLILKHGDHGP